MAQGEPAEASEPAAGEAALAPTSPEHELILPVPRRDPVKERFTFIIALVLVVAFVAVIASIIVVWAISKAVNSIPAISADDVVKLLTTVSGIMAGLVGAVAGYYFRGREEAARRGE